MQLRCLVSAILSSVPRPATYMNTLLGVACRGDAVSLQILIS